MITHSIRQNGGWELVVDILMGFGFEKLGVRVT
jgi:hypothetical protein